jgi:DNA-binding MarR family transcriptional regulator/ribosomal protein S18 acetylase RimI-like enzyme
MIGEHDIALVRGFNRLVTRHVGALSDRYLGRRPLGESRVLFEIGTAGATPRDLRARLGLDSGYLSRMIGSLERDGLVERRPNPGDGRTKHLCLTNAGLSELRDLDRISDELAASALAPLTDEQRARLLRAQAEVRRLLAISMVRSRLRTPPPPTRGGASPTILPSSASASRSPSIPAAPCRPTPRTWYRHRGRSWWPFSGQPAGCGALKTLQPGVGEIMRMWVDSPHRGLGIGARILEALEEQAAALRQQSVRLYTNRSLEEAKAMYSARGYREIARYIDDPYANHWFEKRLA